jgi:hypothetical protein
MLDPEKIEQVTEALKEGKPYRVIEKEFGVSCDSINKVKRILKENGVDLRCKCGRSSDHTGLCAHRRGKNKTTENSQNKFAEIVRRFGSPHPPPGGNSNGLSDIVAMLEAEKQRVISKIDAAIEALR